MKGLQWSLLQGIILTAIIVLIGMMLVGPVKGFDVTKYFGIQPILGQPGTVGPIGIIFTPVSEVNTRCGIFEGWHWKTDSPNPIATIFSETQLLTIDKFQSPACPPGTLPVACGTYPVFGQLDDTSGKKYGEDAIVSIYNETDNTCVVYAQEGSDTNQARYVGVLCANLAPADVQYRWTPFPSPGSGDTEGVNYSCSPGFSPISGMVKADPISTSADAGSRIVGLNTTAAMLKDSDKIFSNRKFGVVCIRNSVYTNCAIHDYVFGKSVDYRHWSKVDTTSTDKIYENFEEEPCPGDSTLISCGYNISTPGDSRINALFSSNLSDNKNFGGSGFLIDTCNVQDSVSRGWFLSTDWYTNTAGVEAVCAENLWYWSDWQTKSSAGNSGLASFGDFSVSCPTGTQAIACASDTASLESGFYGGSDYGDDAIVTINFTADTSNKRTGCHIGALDWSKSNNKQKRRVGALCIQDTYSADFIYKPKQFNDPGTGIRATITSDSCDTDYLPIFCTMENDPSNANTQFNSITAIDIDPTSRSCSFKLVNTGWYQPLTYKGKIGVLCAPDSKVTIPDYKSGSFSHPTDSNPFFQSQVSCPYGIATTALTITDSGDSYTEDYLISTVPTSDESNFVVQAKDSSGGNEHRRKVGVACLNYLEEDFLPPVCGNNKREGSESCDGSALGGKTCLSLSFTGGTLACKAGCIFDTSQCTGQGGPVCGNGVRETGEQCDPPGANSVECCGGTCNAPLCTCSGVTDCLSQCPAATCEPSGAACISKGGHTITGGGCSSYYSCCAYTASSPPCGGLGQNCCSGNPQCNSPYTCDSASGKCISPACGGLTQSCCATGSPCSSGTCLSGYCQSIPTACSGWTTGMCTPNAGCSGLGNGFSCALNPFGCNVGSCCCLQGCGILGKPCCTSNPQCSQGTCDSNSGTCQVCGGLNQGCCPNSICSGSLTCTGGTCQASTSTCTGAAKTCIASASCTSGVNQGQQNCGSGNACCYSPNCVAAGSNPICIYNNVGCDASRDNKGQLDCPTGTTCCVSKTSPPPPQWDFSLSLSTTAITTFDNNPSYSQLVYVYVTSVSGTGTPQQVRFLVADPVPGTTATTPNPCTPSTISPYQCTSSFLITGNPLPPSANSASYPIDVTGIDPGGNAKGAPRITFTVIKMPHCVGTPYPCNQFTFMGAGSCNLLQLGCHDPAAGPCLGTPSPCPGRNDPALCAGVSGHPAGCTFYTS